MYLGDRTPGAGHKQSDFVQIFTTKSKNIEDAVGIWAL